MGREEGRGRGERGERIQLSTKGYLLLADYQITPTGVEGEGGREGREETEKEGRGRGRESSVQ